MQLRKHLRLIIASPRDVDDERDELEAAVADVNRGIALEYECHIDVLRWETDVYPQLHVAGPQGAIDDTFQIQHSDIVVGIFWTRFGTRTKKGLTGTEHELMLAYKSWKKGGTPQVMMYFKTAHPPKFPPPREELEQLTRVLDFRERLPSQLHFRTFSSTKDFRIAITNDLTQYVRDIAKRDAGAEATASRLRSQPPQEDVSKSWEHLRLAEVPLHTFCGLRLETREGDTFQDFRVDRRTYLNPNPVNFMWADVYRGNTVSAMIVEREPPELHLSFENKPMSYPSNVAIRPLEERALRCQNRSALCFEARVPEESQDATGELDRVFLAVRVVNGWNQHWAHGPGNGIYRLLPVARSWTTISLPLRTDRWWRFTSDGNHCMGPVAPDFALLGPVILELGGEGVERPGPGRGRVSIRGFRLV